MPKGLARSMRRGQSRPTAAALLPVQRIPFSVTLAVPDPGSAVAFGGGIFADFPDGNILFKGAVVYLHTVTRGDTDISATFTGNFSLGTTVTADATLNSTDANIIPSTAFATGVAGVSSANRGASTTTETGAIFDNTDGSLEINLNAIIADAAISADSSLIVVGTLFIEYSVLGDD